MSKAARAQLADPPPKKESGAAGRKRRAQQGFEQFEPSLREVLDRIGPPPIGDPLRLTMWQQELTGFTSWAWATGKITPGQAARLRGINESVRTGGMVAVKAQERKTQREIAKRVGIVKDADDGLDDFPEGAVVGRPR